MSTQYTVIIQGTTEDLASVESIVASTTALLREAGTISAAHVESQTRADVTPVDEKPVALDQLASLAAAAEQARAKRIADKERGAADAALVEAQSVEAEIKGG